MEDYTSYVTFLLEFQDSWEQAVMAGILVVGGAALMGVLLHSTIAAFKNIIGR